LVGGTPRAGKTALKKLLLGKYGIPGFCTDYLRDALGHEAPKFGIKKGMSDIEKSEILWPFFKGILNQRIKYYKDDLLVEGTNFLPRYLSEYKEKNDIKMVFLGYADLDPEEKLKQIRNNPGAEGEWTSDMSDSELRDLVDEFIKISKYYESECAKYGIKYFDTSKNFEDVIKQAADYLTGK